MLILFVLLEVVEAEGEDLEDYLKEDFRPILLFSFVLHKSKIVNYFQTGLFPSGLFCEPASGE